MTDKDTEGEREPMHEVSDAWGTGDADDEIIDAIDGLMAYDLGATDAGVHDEHLRERVRAWLTASDPTRPHSLTSSNVERVLRRMICEMLADGSDYGVEDVAVLIRWLDESMGFSL